MSHAELGMTGGLSMIHTWYRVVMLVWVCTVLLGHAARAEEAQPLQPCVLVLPLQASPEMSGDQVFLGLAVQNVLENVLAVHSTLEECRAQRFLRQLFPHQQALRDWVQGTGEVPAAIPETGVRYLLTGQVRLQGQEIQVTVELLDRATGHRLPGTLTVDLPRLEALRIGLMELLAHMDLPVPESHKPKMLWPEDLSLTAFTLLGQGLYTDYSASYDTERAVANPQQFTEALQHAPHSYLVLNKLGWVAYKQQRHAEAVRLFEQALAINPAGADAVDGMIQSGIATGNEALEETWTAHKARLQEKDVQRPLAQMWDQRGAKFYQNSDYPHAIVAWEQALTMWREVKDRDEEGGTLNNLGQAYWALSQYEQAIGSFEQALAIAREVNNRAMEGVTLNNLGAAYRALSQYERAIGSYEQALAIVREVKDRAGEGTTLNNLGAAYWALSQYERAMDYYGQALAIHREVKNRAMEGTTLSNLMIVWKARQAPRLAIFYGKQAVNVYQAIRGDIQTLDKALQQSFLTSNTGTYRTLADLLITAGRLPEAQQVLDLLKAEEYFDFVRRDENAAGGTQQAALTPEESAWEQRYRAIADRVTALGVERQALMAKSSRTAKEDTRLDALEQDLTVAAQAFQQLLSGLAEAFRGTPEGSARLAEVREAQGLMADLADLGRGTVALYTLVGDKTYRVILITPHTQVARDSPITAADLNRKVLALREALRTPLVDPRPLAQELYKILAAPVANDLKGARAQTLMWSLDGVLRYLPVAALHDGEAYLVERYRHVMFTPASQARLKDAPQATWKGLGLGVSKAHGEFVALPGVVEELQGIIRDKGQAASTGVLPGALKLDAAFTAPAMRAALRQRYPVVHIASHFHFRPGNETASFLLLGDGSHLPLSEIKTWPNVFAGVDLLTLSACETAMGNAAADGKEVEGFGVLAQRQGAKAVIATLWPVADASTKALMQELYRRHKTQPKLPKIEALRQAQLALLQGQKPVRKRVAQGQRGISVNAPGAEPSDSSTAALPRFPLNPRAPYAHPFYWAPFILIGNWK
jgi:CHAT domain-containing protein/Tfp pilus assembly protein PilF